MRERALGCFERGTRDESAWDVYMAAGSRARGIRRRLEAGRTRSRGAEKAEARGASERENRQAVEGKEMTCGPRQSAGKGGAARRSISSDRANAAAARFGPTDR